MIRLLSPILISRIAAGEVIERPASVVKELVENAVDAGAKQITIQVMGAGISRISVTDDGFGMGVDELLLAIQRHATSKIPDDDLDHLAFLGFRGEALPAIGSVSRLSITSRRAHDETAWTVQVEGGVAREPAPASAPIGTRVDVEDLFYATPARLKFLKSATTEMQHITDCIERLAMVHAHIAFVLQTEQRTILDTRLQTAPTLPMDTNPEAGHLARITHILGESMNENVFTVNTHHHDYRLFGRAGLPTFHRAQADKQYLFVNQRPVRDKIWAGALRAAYRDVMAHDRHPVAALFLTLPSDDVDVNVHPAKAEVRFRDAAKVRHFLITALQQSLSQEGHRVAPARSEAAIAAFRASVSQPSSGKPLPRSSRGRLSLPQSLRPRAAPWGAPPPLVGVADAADAPSATGVPEMVSSAAPHTHDIAPDAREWVTSHPLGQACAQLHATYILAQTDDGIVLVDQHAAHERLVYEELKKQLTQGQLERQPLLVPDVVTLTLPQCEALMSAHEVLAAAGLVIETFGVGAVLVRECPQLLIKADLPELIRDIAGDIVAEESSERLTERLLERFSRQACHGSIRAGQQLSVREMDALLRAMEANSLSGQCNHGRPTYVKLTLAQIETLFGRH